MKQYNIVRFFSDRTRPQIIIRGVTLEEAQVHCEDINTSSRTCYTKSGLARTRRHGAWFDGYREQ